MAIHSQEKTFKRVWKLIEDLTIAQREIGRQQMEMALLLKKMAETTNFQQKEIVHLKEMVETINIRQKEMKRK